MSENTGKILCPETQAEEDTSLVARSPRLASVGLDYLGFITNGQKPEFPHCSFSPGRAPWTIISPIRDLGVMNIDLLSMTWEEFQILALEHVKQSPTINPLFRLLRDANYIGALEWRVTLSGHPDYTSANKIQVAGDASFSKFAEAAYDFFPNAVVFKMIMREPNDPPADSMPADGNSVKRAHPMDADGERRPAIALRTPGAYRFQKVSGSGNQGLSTGQSNSPQPGPDDGVNASPLGGRGHGAVQNNQSTGSRSVTRAVTKDGPKGMSTPKTSAPKTHEVGPSPLATNTTAPRVPAGRQPVSTDEIEVIRGPLTATARRVVSLPSTRVIQSPQAGLST
ncbi:hypothetical protein PtA15_1A473 [Puccinia triticina]|uniref:Uncharacterized protein n=1 Tax=Puccinia triticina TaxID=208348 RepID=A0ABY7C7L5_9BASI|nr:uncharacterized protein PtA15_1A473 [Puccinia triticina]WAQ81134.1 hypothetical protein PtA15_1A473 [Puccinia triticina]WAR52026.1 hypothetical protein PtB15_1B465 [Puccinia triticina]